MTTELPDRFLLAPVPRSLVAPERGDPYRGPVLAYGVEAIVLSPSQDDPDSMVVYLDEDAGGWDLGVALVPLAKLSLNLDNDYTLGAAYRWAFEVAPLAVDRVPQLFLVGDATLPVLDRLLQVLGVGDPGSLAFAILRLPHAVPKRHRHALASVVRLLDEVLSAKEKP